MEKITSDKFLEVVLRKPKRINCEGKDTDQADTTLLVYIDF